jgi:hypothetical protein
MQAPILKAAGVGGFHGAPTRSLPLAGMSLLDMQDAHQLTAAWLVCAYMPMPAACCKRRQRMPGSRCMQPWRVPQQRCLPASLGSFHCLWVSEL